MPPPAPIRRTFPALKDPETGVLTVFPRAPRLRAPAAPTPLPRTDALALPSPSPSPSPAEASPPPRRVVASPAPGQGGTAPPTVAAAAAAAISPPAWLTHLDETYFPPMLLPPGKTQVEPAPNALKDIRPDSGAAIELAALGPEDKFLTIDPSYSFFRAAYRRPTPFAIQQQEEYFRNGFAFGRTCVLALGLQGDLVNDAWLELQLPALGAGAWVPYVGYAAVRTWRFYVGDVLVQTIPRDWMFFEHSTRVRASKLAGLDAMVGAAPLDASVAHTLYVPMPFFFASMAAARKVALPVAAASNAAASTNAAPVRIEIDVEALNALVRLSAPAPGPAPAALACTALVDYVLLGDEERASVIGYAHRILFRAVLSASAPAYLLSSAGVAAPLSAAPVRLDGFNLPIATLVVVAKDEDDASNGTLFEYRRIDAIDLFLTSQKRFETRPGSYFSLPQFYDHADGVPSVAANVYQYAFTVPRALHHLVNAGHVDAGRAFLDPTLRAHGVQNAAAPPARVLVLAEAYSFLTLEDGFARLDRVG